MERDPDLLEMTGTEAEVARVNGELRDLRRELAGLDEDQLYGREVDAARRGEITTRIEALSARQRELFGTMRGADEEAPRRTLLDHVIDVWVDHKVLVLLILSTAIAVGSYLALNLRSGEAMYKVAERDLQLAREALDLTEEELPSPNKDTK